MKAEKSKSRQRKQHKRRYGMRIDGESCKLLEQIKKDKAKEVKNG